jgi:DNA modification methylase
MSKSYYPYYERDGVQIYHGDCLEMLDDLRRADAVIGDPPWGADTDCDYTRFSGGLAPNHHHHGIQGDDQPFDPSPWLDFENVILWGYQFFAERLPLGTVLVWNKKRDNQLGTFLSDGELAWQKGGKGCYIFQHTWHGFDRATERNEPVLHPSQKPVRLMEWCIERVTEPGALILDPYMGSGSTGVAAIATGRRFIGVEIDEQYCERAVKRLSQMSLFEVVE